MALAKGCGARLYQAGAAGWRRWGRLDAIENDCPGSKAELRDSNLQTRGNSFPVVRNAGAEAGKDPPKETLGVRHQDGERVEGVGYLWLVGCFFLNAEGLNPVSHTGKCVRDRNGRL